MRQRGAAERVRVIPGSVWPSHDGELRRLWAEGLSSRIIANRMGVSKNAVLSRAHRLGLPQRAPGPQPEGPFAMGGPGIATVPKAARVVPARSASRWKPRRCLFPPDHPHAQPLVPFSAVGRRRACAAPPAVLRRANAGPELLRSSRQNCLQPYPCRII